MRRLPLLLATLAMAALTVPAGAQDLSDARSSLRSGDYEDALRDYQRVLRQDEESLEARLGVVEVLTVLGRYEEAESVAREGGGASINALGEVLVHVGRYEDALAAFEQAARGPVPYRLAARANRGELLLALGRIDEAMAVFDSFIDVYNGADGRLSARDLFAVSRAVRHLGRTDPNLFQDALRAADEASQADPGWAAPTVLAGNLFLEKYSSPEAKTEFEKVLARNPRHPGALMGMAESLDFDGAGSASQQAEAVLEVNPSSVPATLFLARRHLSREGHEPAREGAEAALEVNPASLEALSVLAGSHFLRGDHAAFSRVRAQALAINPRYAGLDATVSELAVQVRRYEAAAERAAAAVALDSAAWEAWGLLGMNQLRIGEIEEGRANLARAFAGDPYNPWFKNSLDLLDTFDRFDPRTTAHFELFLHNTEADLLEPYVAAIAEEAWDSMTTRYGAEPPTPVRVELFPSHADFSVRTLGETGLGALGVSFGSLLVMDSPAARERGQYNWASTLWHELAHAFHLGITEHRVPRWFSEGLAVHEQRNGRPWWGHQPSIPFLQALRDGRLKTVSELNDGFMRPDYPQQVSFSYYQASLVFQVIEDRHGFEAIRNMLAGYRRGETTADLFTSVLGSSLEDFDDEFAAYMRDRFRDPLAGLAKLGEAPPAQAGIEALQDYLRSHPGDLIAQLRVGAALVRAERYDEAKPWLTEVLRTFPEYSGPDSPYLYLARVHEAEGDLERAAAALARLNGLNESNYDALLREADLQERLGRNAEATAALKKAVEVFPYDIAVHLRLAALAAEAGDHATVVRERRAVVALDPADRAEALYLLAVAHRDAGDRTAARRAVLRSLDVAPTYEAALELLLELRGATEGVQ